MSDNEFIKCICGATAKLDENKKAYVCNVCLTENPVKERSKKMGKKGICEECKREMTIVGHERCWKCYTEYRKKKGTTRQKKCKAKKHESLIEHPTKNNLPGNRYKPCILSEICKHFVGK